MSKWKMTKGPAESGRGEELLEDAEELEEHAVHSLRHTFGEKRLSLRTMDPPLRLGTAILAACLLATVLAISLRDAGGKGVFLGEASGAITSISPPAFVVALILISIGFGYVFTAVTDAGPIIAFPTIGILLFLVGLYTGAFGSLIGGLDYSRLLPSWTSWLTRGILVAILLVTGAVQLFDRHRARPRRRSVRLEILAVYSVLVGGYFFAIHAGSPTVGRLNLYGPIVAAILGYLSFVLYPILQVVAVDFGEWGEIAGHRLSFMVRDRATGLLVVGFAATTGVLVYGSFHELHSSHHLASLLRAGAIGTVFLGVIIAVMVGLVRIFRSRWRSHPKSINFAGLVAVCAVVFVLVPPLSLYLSGGIPHLGPVLTQKGRFAPGSDVITVEGAPGPTAFSFQVPRGWLILKKGDFVLASNYGPDHSYQRVESGLFPVSIPLAGILQGLKLSAAGPVSHDGKWEGEPVASPGVHGLLWAQSLKGKDVLGTYFLYETVHGRFGLKESKPLFAAVLNSFRGGGAHPAPLPPPAKATSGQGNFGEQVSISLGLLFGLSAILLLAFALARRRTGEQLVVGVLLLLLVSLVSLAFYLQPAAHYLFGSGFRPPYFGQHDLVLGCGLLGLGSMVVCALRKAHLRPAGRRFITGVVGLEGAVAVLLVAQWVYNRALSANRIPIWAGVIVLLAAIWELTMSGESLTNRDTARLPRATRLFAFFGYLVILSGVVLFSSAEKVIATGHPAESGFEPESITQAALFRVGLPVLLLLFLVHQLAGGTKGSLASEPGPVTPPVGAGLEPPHLPDSAPVGAETVGAGAAGPSEPSSNE